MLRDTAEACTGAHSEQERRAKSEEARAETERILAQQAAELAAKKADMQRRDAERELVKAAKVRPQRLHPFGGATRQAQLRLVYSAGNASFLRSFNQTGAFSARPV